MAYRRPYGGRSGKRWFDDLDEPQKCNVVITWDQVTNAAYTVRFNNIGPHFEKCKIIFAIIKSAGSSQYEYDGDTKTWYVGEKTIESVKSACEAMPDVFDVTFTEKPSGMPTAKLYPVADDVAEFKRMLSFAHITLDEELKVEEFNKYKKLYFRASRILHPDVSPDMADQMYTLNIVWDRLQYNFFKTKKGVPLSDGE